MNEDTPTKAEILARLTDVDRKIGVRILALGGTRDLAIGELIETKALRSIRVAALTVERMRDI